MLWHALKEHTSAASFGAVAPRSFLMRLCMEDSLRCGCPSADVSTLRSSATWQPCWKATSSTSTASSKAFIFCAGRVSLSCELCQRLQYTFLMMTLVTRPLSHKTGKVGTDPVF